MTNFSIGLIGLLILCLLFAAWLIIEKVKYYQFQKKMQPGAPCKVREGEKRYIGKIEAIKGIWIEVRFIRPAKTPDGYTKKCYYRENVYPR